MEEDRRSHFKRIATKRVNNLLNQIRILSNLSNKSYYDYNEEDVNKMFKVLEEQLKIVKTKFKFVKQTFKF
ncbi:hypothetical protein HZC27_02945 [Candidatus Roizmanbacteria bacterium]|nr:hypothetical protein [Candidatus Roizmanbacteria bacterium]